MFIILVYFINKPAMVLVPIIVIAGVILSVLQYGNNSRFHGRCKQIPMNEHTGK